MHKYNMEHAGAGLPTKIGGIIKDMAKWSILQFWRYLFAAA